MPHPRATSHDLRAEAGSAMVELIAWSTLVAIPLLLLGIAAARAEQAYTATQSLARELAREASLGLDYTQSTPILAADFGLTASDFEVAVACVTDQQPCRAFVAHVGARAYRFIPMAASTMLVTP